MNPPPRFRPDQGFALDPPGLAPSRPRAKGQALWTPCPLRWSPRFAPFPVGRKGKCVDAAIRLRGLHPGGWRPVRPLSPRPSRPAIRHRALKVLRNRPPKLAASPARLSNPVPLRRPRCPAPSAHRRVRLWPVLSQLDFPSPFTPPAPDLRLLRATFAPAICSLRCSCSAALRSIRSRLAHASPPARSFLTVKAKKQTPRWPGQN